MNKLEQLIQEKCPNGVEYIKIKDIAEVKVISVDVPKKRISLTMKL